MKTWFQKPAPPSCLPLTKGTITVLFIFHRAASGLNELDFLAAISDRTRPQTKLRPGFEDSTGVTFPRRSGALHGSELPGEEVRRGVVAFWGLYSIFPEVTICNCCRKLSLLLLLSQDELLSLFAGIPDHKGQSLFLWFVWWIIACSDSETVSQNSSTFSTLDSGQDPKS